MDKVYLSEESLLRDYKKLSKDYKIKAERYIKNLLRLQREENYVLGKLNIVSKEDTYDMYCNFCGKSSLEVLCLIASGEENDTAYICNECARLCGEIVDEQETK